MGKTKVWRLSKKGREVMGVTRAPRPLNHRNLDHMLTIANVYMDLWLSVGLDRFEYEPRETYTLGSIEKTYSPDAFLIYRGKAYVLEVQLSPLTSDRWAMKWAQASEFFDSGAFKRASWIKDPTRIFKPKIVVISTQQTETILSGSKLQPLIVRSSLDFLQGVTP